MALMWRVLPLLLALLPLVVIADDPDVGENEVVDDVVMSARVESCGG